MALFGRDYDRNYGYNRDNNRDMGDRMRGGWNRMENSARRGWNRAENGTRDAFDMGGYDRDYNRGYGNTGYRGTGYEQGFDRDNRFGAGTNRTGYDRDYGNNTGMTGYDRNYKSRQQTDFGDPFGDRQNRTPIRVMRGEYQGGYDNNYRGNDMNRNTSYDRDYGSNPMGYDPYYGNNNNFGNNSYGNNAYGYNRGYDRNF